MTLLRYLLDNADTVLRETATHLRLVVITVAVSTVTGLVLGVVGARSRRFFEVTTAVASAILTIPSFALFGLLAIALNRVGDLPVIVGLILYAQLPILRNTSVGIRGVDPAVVEAARGMGMRPSQVLRRIQIPLALPPIVAGLRQATVMIVAIATVGAALGSNNLGQPIFQGIRSGSRIIILSGVIPVAALGILADLVLAGTERALSHRRTPGQAA